MLPLTFPELDQLGLPHCFTLRQDRIDPLPSNAAGVLALHEFDFRFLVQAEQTHGKGIACVDKSQRGQSIPQVDALITNDPTVTLVIRVADCGPVYFYDPVQKAIALAHSGKKGSEVGISLDCIKAMASHFGSKAEDIVAILGPCIRVPDYDIDFPAQIAAQIQEAGVRQFYDSRLNTAGDLSRFYSYRKELGKTGRHFAALQLPAF